MAKDRKKSSARDGARIELNQSIERNAWAEKFGVTHDQLKEAVYSVGDQADRVQAYLKQVYGDPK